MQRMDRLRRSLRDSFRRKRDSPESSKPHQWQADEEAVRVGNCSFHVKYLGCVEVYESRGMTVCEEAMKVLRASRRRPVRSILYISGDGLRVCEDDTKGLIVDQTIEKVSFCAPDKNHERGFSYICRDGTTRRWMCHGFLAVKDSGERLSHAVGCAFAACLERKQRREKECGVSMTFDPKTSTFTRSGSFRVNSITDSKSSSSTSPPLGIDNSGSNNRPVHNTHAIERPHAPVKMLERQGSFRGFSQLANQSPFKRQLSLRLSDLPSNLQRTHQNSIDIFTNNNVTIPPLIPPVNASPTPPPRTQRNRLHSLPTNSLAGHITSTIPESNSLNGSGDSVNNTSVLKIENKDLVSELCQQMTQGLSLLVANHDDNLKAKNSSQYSGKFTNPWDDEIGPSKLSSIRSPPLPALNTTNSRIGMGSVNSTNITPVPLHAQSLVKATGDWPQNNLNTGNISSNKIMSSSPLSSSRIVNQISSNISNEVGPSNHSLQSGSVNSPLPSGKVVPERPRPPLLSSASIAGAAPPNGQGQAQGHGIMMKPTYRGAPLRSQSLGNDPFDADWAAPVARTGQTPTNPFARQQTFQVSM